MVVKEDLSKRIAKLGLSRVTGKGYGLCKTLYIPVDEGFIEILEKFDDLAWKEHKRWGELMRDAIEEYVRRHHPGNPQLPIHRYLDINTDAHTGEQKSIHSPCLHSTGLICEHPALVEGLGKNCWRACPQAMNEKKGGARRAPRAEVTQV